MIRIILPTYLQRLANIEREISLEIAGDVNISLLIDLLEEKYPMLKGTIRDHYTGERREYLRFFACGIDLSNNSLKESLPEEVIDGREPFRIVGAMSGG